MIKLSKPFCLQLAGQSSLKDIVTDTVIRIFDGAVPTNADDSVGSSNLLVEIRASDGSGLMFEIDSSGIVKKDSSQEWNGTATNTGRATFFRLVKDSDTNGNATTETRIQGTVSNIGADITLTNPDITAGAVIPIGSGGFYFTTSA